MNKEGKMSVTEINMETGKKTVREYTQEELAAQAAYAPSALDIWKREMTTTDVLLPRYAEDIIDVLTPEQRSSLPAATLNNYNTKKSKRLERPQ